MPETHIHKGFVISFTKEEVTCKMLSGEIRMFKIYPLFAGTKLFKGKNFWIEEVIKDNKMTLTFKKLNKSMAVHLWNYYIKNDFKIKEK